MRLTVIGTGYLGATHAACMAELGHEVLGVDIDPDKVAALRSGRLPFYEPGLPELLARHLASGRLRFSTSMEEAAVFADTHFVCVGTPQREGSGQADLSYVESVTEELGRRITRPATVIGKSTVPVGTAARLAARLSELSPVGAAAQLAWNPEFLREGYGVKDTLGPDRLVFGVSSPSAEQVLRAVYAPMLDVTPLIVCDLPTAELVKVSANAFLATKISFINAMAEVCEVAGADVHRLAQALGLDERIGSRFLSPGLGFGGGCLPKDIRAFAARAGELGNSSVPALMGEVDRINRRRRERTVELALQLAGREPAGARFAVWGAAFKPGTDDIRDSPALAVADGLRHRGAQVSVFDPEAMGMARKHHADLDFAVSAEDAVEGADVLLHLTEWPQFSRIDPAQLARRARGRGLLDARGTLDHDAWAQAGWQVRLLGSGTPDSPITP